MGNKQSRGAVRNSDPGTDDPSKASSSTLPGGTINIELASKLLDILPDNDPSIRDALMRKSLPFHGWPPGLVHLIISYLTMRHYLVVFLNGHIGQSQLEDNESLPTTQVYAATLPLTPTTKWIALPSLPYRRLNAAIVAHRGRLFIAGGHPLKSSTDVHSIPLTSSAGSSSESKEWSLITTMPRICEEIASNTCLLDDGRWIFSATVHPTLTSFLPNFVVGRFDPFACFSH
jgi:hypothetical protein